MTTQTALVLIAGLLVWAILDHWLRVARLRLAVRPADPPPAEPIPDIEDHPMSLSDQQLRTLGLNHVRRRIAAGNYTDEDIERWTDELGDEVREMVPKKSTKKRAKKESTSSDKE